jgi:hypothetical protein
LDGLCYIAPYDWGDGGLCRAYGTINREILDTLVARMDDDVDFSEYDNNPRDGFVVSHVI